MSITSLLIEKFKSYSNCKIDGLNEKINIVFGKNGSGKSNLLSALAFLCSDQYDRADRAQLMKNYREGEPKVEARLNNLVQQDKSAMSDALPAKIIPTSGDAVVVSRTLGERENSYKVDDRNASLNQFNSIFECFGVQRKNPFTIIAQNRVQEIANMSDAEIYKLLQQAAGVEAFLIKQEKAKELFEKSQKEKVGIEASLQEVEEKIEQLGSERENYEKNQEQEILLQTLQWLYYEKTKEELNNKKLECDKEIKGKNDKLQEEKSKLQSMESEKEVKNEEMKQLKDKLSKIEKIEDSVKNDQKQVDEKLTGMQNSLSELKSIKESRDERKMESRLKAVTQEQVELQKQADTISKGIQEQKDKMEEQDREYDKLVVREKFKTNEEREKYCTQRRKELQASMTETKSKEDKLRKRLTELKNRATSAQNEADQAAQALRETQAEVDTQQHSMNQKKNEMQKLRQSQLEKRKLLSDKRIEFEESNEKTKKKAEEIQKQLKSSLLSVIERLEQAIEEEKIKGYMGLLIDHLEISSKLAYAYDIAQKTKLFSLVVDNENTAERILQLVKTIDAKGANLNIFPLSWVDQDNNDDVENIDGSDGRVNVTGFGFQKLFDKKYIKAKVKKGEEKFAQKIEKLAEQIFGNYGIVNEYEHAVEVAAKFRINCITVGRQIAYAGGFVSRVGFCGGSKLDKITLYREYKKYKDDGVKSKGTLKELQSEIDELTVQQNELQSGISKETVKLTSLQSTVFMNRQLLKSSELEARVAQNEQQEAAQQLVSLSSQKEEVTLQLTEVEDIAKKTKYTPLTESEKQQMYNIQEWMKKQTAELQKIMKEKAAVEKNLSDKNGEIQQLKDLLEEQEGTKSWEEISNRIESIQRDIDHQTTLLQTHNKILEKTKNSKQTLNDQIHKLQNDLNKAAEVNMESIEQQKQQCINLEQELGVLLLRKQQQLSKENELEEKKSLLNVSGEVLNNWNSKTREDIRKQLTLVAQQSTLKKYTARDKILFEKIADLESKQKEYAAKYESLQKNEADTKELIAQFTSKSDQTIKLAFSKFEHYLKQYFNKLAPQGSIEVKLLSNKQISTNLAFKSTSSETKKTNRKDLSGGEKSCLAIIILMALQKCDPAPFYIFDEFDAALDQNYIRQLASIISENCKKSQFIIVSHKPDLLQSLNPADCKCFQITLKDKISEITETSLDAAINFVKEG